MRLLSVMISVIALLSPVAHSAPGDSYNIYLVRHAEKQKTPDNPHLTQCGKFRAKQLADILRHVELKGVYSTSYNRTLETAKPIADIKKLGVKHYSPRGLMQLARQVKQNQEDVLIVGHSNTTPELASLFLGEPVDKMDETEYQHLFQLQVNGKKTTLVKLTQPLDCSAFK